MPKADSDWFPTTEDIKDIIKRKQEEPPISKEVKKEKRKHLRAGKKSKTYK